jgi:hypothetical protein
VVWCRSWAGGGGEGVGNGMVVVEEVVVVGDGETVRPGPGCVWVDIAPLGHSFNQEWCWMVVADRGSWSGVDVCRRQG